MAKHAYAPAIAAHGRVPGCSCGWNAGLGMPSDCAEDVFEGHVRQVTTVEPDPVSDGEPQPVTEEPVSPTSSSVPKAKRQFGWPAAVFAVVLGLGLGTGAYAIAMNTHESVQDTLDNRSAEQTSHCVFDRDGYAICGSGIAGADTMSVGAAKACAAFAEAQRQDSPDLGAEALALAAEAPEEGLREAPRPALDGGDWPQAWRNLDAWCRANIEQYPHLR